MRFSPSVTDWRAQGIQEIIRPNDEPGPVEEQPDGLTTTSRDRRRKQGASLSNLTKQEACSYPADDRRQGLEQSLSSFGPGRRPLIYLVIGRRCILLFPTSRSGPPGKVQSSDSGLVLPVVNSTNHFASGPPSDGAVPRSEERERESARETGIRKGWETPKATQFGVMAIRRSRPLPLKE
ncbi:uncharacterized protein PG986_003858 [Apiospora aurea]|uniref:Uncharacterized protein n=1 Tax=Apiospora aurea TaxID=335848 RepID=A0ABR1QMH3_9PEZI